MPDSQILIITWSLSALLWAVTLAGARWLPDEPVAWAWPRVRLPRWRRYRGGHRKPMRLWAFAGRPMTITVLPHGGSYPWGHMMAVHAGMERKFG